MERAARLDGVTYAIRDVVKEAERVKKEQPDQEILHLNIGDPLKFDFDTPQHMIDAVTTAMAEQRNGYAPSKGVGKARQAVARHVSQRTGASISKADVLPGYGASEGIHAALTTVLNPGENVLTPSPGYPQYTALVNLLNGELNEYRCREEKGWEPDVEDMRRQINEDTKAIVLINPNNPTGAVYSEETLREIIDVAGEYNLPVITDEIYSKLVHGPDHTFASVLEVAADVPVLKMGGLSKNYVAPGWRTGWAVRHDPGNELENIWEGMQQLARVRLSTNQPMQCAVPAALNGSQNHVEEMREKLHTRASIIHETINDIAGLSVEKPLGAFYAFVKIEEELMQHFDSDKEFVYRLLRETGVLVVHGSGFGSGVAADHFRVVFLPDEDTLAEACEKIAGFVANHR